MEAFLTEIIDIRDTSYTIVNSMSLYSTSHILTAANKNFICSVLVSQLWGIALSRLLKRDISVCRSLLAKELTYEFDGDTAVVQEVQSLEDYTERPCERLARAWSWSKKRLLAFTDLLSHSIVHTHSARSQKHTQPL